MSLPCQGQRMSGPRARRGSRRMSTPRASGVAVWEVRGQWADWWRHTFLGLHPTLTRFRPLSRSAGLKRSQLNGHRWVTVQKRPNTARDECALRMSTNGYGWCHITHIPMASCLVKLQIPSRRQFQDKNGVFAMLYDALNTHESESEIMQCMVKRFMRAVAKEEKESRMLLN